MAKHKVADVATKIVTLLTPLNSEERQRAVQAALTLVGESPAVLKEATGSDVEKNEAQETGIAPRAKTWMRQHGLEMMSLQQVFHLEGGNVEVIASKIPGKSDKEKTLNAYVIEGVRCLLASGEPGFDDKSARTLCKTHGCYNDANHAVYLRDKGNRLTGSKEKGWKLTAPGLAHAASLITEMTKDAK
jgi:hypothetical protein